MKQYFAKVTSCYWTEKNALHGALLNMIKGMDCTLFQESELEDFVKALYDSVDILNSKFKRCKPFKLEVMSEVERHYYIAGVFHISIYEVAREFKKANIGCSRFTFINGEEIQEIKAYMHPRALQFRNRKQRPTQVIIEAHEQFDLIQFLKYIEYLKLLSNALKEE